MSISNSVKSLLNMTGHKQGDLVEILQVKTKQALSNKFKGERWSASDLISVAEYTGCKLAFVLPDGERLLISGGSLDLAAPVGDIDSAAVGRVTPANTPKE